MNENEKKLDQLFSALSDQTRRNMLKMLSKSGLTVSEVGESFGLSKQAISKHLKVLEEAGLISKEKDGRIQRCKFNPNALEPIQKNVDQYREFWNHQFDALGEYINSMNKQKKNSNDIKLKY